MEDVERLLKKGVPVDVAGDAGMTALMMAATYGQKDVILLLLKSGADVDKKSDLGTTAADSAKATNNKEILAILEDASKKKAQ